MVWVQWLIVGVAAVGFVVLVALGFRLWHKVRAFFALLGRASTTLTEASATLAEATATLESAQSAGSSRSRGQVRGPALH